MGLSCRISQRKKMFLPKLYVVLSCLFFPSIQGEPCAHDVEEVKVQVEILKKDLETEMKLAITEIFRTKEKNMEENILKLIREELRNLREVNTLDMSNQNHQLKEEVANLMKENEAMRERLQNVESTVDISTKTKPNIAKSHPVMMCAYQDHWITPNATITYDRTLVDHSTHFDIESGLFTCVHGGIYTVSVSGLVRVDPGKVASIFLYKNGLPEDGARWDSFNHILNPGHIEEQGSFNTLVELSPGDTLELCTDEVYFSGELYFPKFC